MPRTLGRDHRHIHGRRRNNLLEVDIEAVREHQGLAGATAQVARSTRRTVVDPRRTRQRLPGPQQLVPHQATFALSWRAVRSPSPAVPDGHDDHVAERARAREVDDDEGRRLLRIIRRGTGSVVT